MGAWLWLTLPRYKVHRANLHDTFELRVNWFRFAKAHVLKCCFLTYNPTVPIHDRKYVMYLKIKLPTL